MWMKISLFLLLFFLSFNSHAEEDVLLLKAILEEPPNTLNGLPRPKPGMSMENVLKVFGAPKSKTNPIGKPPILQWNYASYVVYFEDRFVINTVMKKAPVK